MKVRKATANDIDKLISLRIEFILEDMSVLSEKQDTVIRTQLEKYLIKHINNDFIAVVAEIDNKLVSTAFLVITEKPANPSFLTGKTATLLNVYTKPEYRRIGLAKKVVSQIIEEANKLGVGSIDLYATEAGKPLYKMLGFKEPKCTAMKLQLEK